MPLSIRGDGPAFVTPSGPGFALGLCIRGADTDFAGGRWVAAPGAEGDAVLRGEAAIAAKDIKVGDRTVVHATKKGEQLVAAEVKLGLLERKGMAGKRTE
jgi:hypothetical protein